MVATLLAAKPTQGRPW